MGTFKEFAVFCNTPKAPEPTIEVEMVDQVDSMITLQNTEGLRWQIDESLVRDNHLAVENNRLLLPLSLYTCWFGRAREAVQKKEAARLWQLYAENIALFWRHRELIINDPRLFFAQTPFKVGIAYVNLKHRGPYVLGIIAQAWDKYPDRYTYPCRKCGEKMVVYSFGGSPLSGCSSRSARCAGCDAEINHESSGHFGTMFKPMSLIAEESAGRMQPDAMTLDEAIAFLKAL